MNMLLSADIFKTAHTLLSRHGECLMEALDEKLMMYQAANDDEAVNILKGIRKAAQYLNTISTQSVAIH